MSRVERRHDHTLFGSAIKKSVETRKREKFDITSKLPKWPRKCEICKESFAPKKYHDTYVQCKHGSDVNFKSKPVSTPSSTESEEISYDEYTLVLDDPGVVDTREDELAKPENRRGSSQ